jgi:Fe-S cluster assembly protein SufD
MNNSILTTFSFESLLHSEVPPVLAGFRLRAWERFNLLSAPRKNDEKWRFSNAPSFQIQDNALPPTPSAAEIKKITARSRLIEDPTAQFVFLNGHVIRHDPLPTELLAQGVTFETIEDALNRDRSLLETLQQEAPLGSEKFLALHQAYLQNGYILRVPPGVEIAKPIISYNWVHGANTAIFPHAIVLAGENSRVNVVDFHLAASEKARNTLAIGASSIFAAAGAKVTRTSVQDWSSTTRSFQVDTTRAERDAEITTIALNLGSDYARLENDIHLLGPGASIHPRALTVATGRQRFDQRTLQIHNAPGATSNLLFKNALFDTSRTIFSGLIQVAPHAQKTDAYQTNRNLLLSPSAEAVSLPGLEIAANDVKCSHGATNSEIDPDELFYLHARGIQDATARELLVFGFFEEILGTAGSPAVSEALRCLIREKLKQEE